MKDITDEYKHFVDKVSKDFYILSKFIKSCNIAISQSEEYDYPITIVSEDSSTNLGELLCKAGQMGNELTYFATYLDFLVKWGILPSKSIFDFKKLYRQHENHCCLLTIYKNEKKVIFMPYK